MTVAPHPPVVTGDPSARGNAPNVQMTHVIRVAVWSVNSAIKKKSFSFLIVGNNFYKRMFNARVMFLDHGYAERMCVQAIDLPLFTAASYCVCGHFSPGHP